jgi:hypothetical protein
MEIDTVFEMLCFLVSRILDSGKKSKNPVILKAIISSTGYGEARTMAG